ncbi:MAG: HlyD family secretion protein [Steroidobacteraceae bacterium]|jgi:membrane fusion protein, multidrug efflux system
MNTPNPTPAPHPAASSPSPPASSPPASKLPLIIGAAAIVGVIAIAAYFVVPSWYSERTDDAYVTAHLTMVTAKVPAYVQTLHVDDNAAVKAGELLVELDPRDYAVQVDIARANLEAARSRLKEADDHIGIADADVAQARAELAVARANEVLAQANLKRLHSVSDARAVSSERVDTATAAAEATSATVTASETKVRSAATSADLARAQLKTAEASVAQAQAALAQAQLNLSYTKITAVESGTIANKIVEEGNYVQPGQTLFSIVPEHAYVIANFKETQLAGIRPGQAASIRVDAYPRLRLKGHVESLQRGTGSVFALLPPENATGNFVKVVQRVPVKIVFDDPYEAARWISPGMSVEAQVRTAR